MEKTDNRSQHQIEDKIKEQNHFISAVAETMPDMVSVIRLDGLIIEYTNHEPFSAYGFDPAILSGMRLEDRAALIHPEDRHIVHSYFTDFLNATDDQVHTVEYRAKLETADWMWFRARGRVFQRDDEGKPTHCINVVQNITESKKAMNVLIEAERLGFLNKMSKSVAHEVRNPLSVITMASHFIHEEASKRQDETVLEYIEMIERNAKRIDKLISELLYIDKEESNPVLLGIHELVDEALNLLSDRLTLSQIKVEKKFDFTGRLSVDKEEILIVLLSLLTNAIEAMEKGRGMLQIEVRAEADKYVISVCDNGPGIPDDELDKIFEPFFSRKIYGMGLGLFNARELIKKNNGELKVKSKIGAGTEFSIYFNTARPG